jgi:hypothetical protein
MVRVPVEVRMGDMMVVMGVVVVRVPTDDLHRISVAVCFNDYGARHMFGLGL